MAPRPTAYLSNLAAALVFALAVILLSLAWFDLVGYQHFLASWRNL